MTCLFVLLLLRVAFSVHSSGDYTLTAPGGDNAAPGIAALLHGSVIGYLRHQPIVGLTSIIVRLPAVAIASAFGAGNFTIYKIGAFACLVPVALGAAWLVCEPDLSWRARLVRVLAVLLVIKSAILRNSIHQGHPEGVLATVLAVAAVLAAARGRARSAAVLLGLAIAAKQTSVIAIPPVIIALPQRRREVCLISGAIVFLLMGVPWLADPAALMRAVHAEGTTMLVIPLSLIWPLTSPIGAAGMMPFGLDRIDATLAMMVPAALIGGRWYLRAHRRGVGFNPLALLALLGVLRCVCDSTHELYYYISMLIPLAAWEASENRVPVTTMLTFLVVPWMFIGLGRVPSYFLYLGSTAGELSLVVYLARRAIIPALAGETIPAAGSLRNALGTLVRKRSRSPLLAYARSEPEAEG